MSHPITIPKARRFRVRRIIQANIDRLTLLLKTETDPTNLAMETRLLDEEKAKLRDFEKNSDKKKAY